VTSIRSNPVVGMLDLGDPIGRASWMISTAPEGDHRRVSPNAEAKRSLG